MLVAKLAFHKFCRAGFLGILAWQLSACGTMAGKSEILSIDSEPRGAAVIFDAQYDDPIGYTPLFVKTQRGRTQQFTLQLEEGKPKAVSIDCGVRWKDAIIGDALLGLTMSPIPPILALTIDFLNGAMFECPEHTRVVMAQKSDQPALEKCRKFLVVPPRHDDEFVSEQLAQTWASNIRGRLRSCDTVLPTGDAEAELAYFNVNHNSDFSIDKIDRADFNRIGFETKATHIVLLDYSLKGTLLEIVPTIYDIHDLRKWSGSSDLRVALPKGDMILSGGNKSWWRALYAFLPNSFYFAPFYTRQMNFDSNASDIGHSGYHTNNLFPNYITGFGFIRVDHPSAFGVWGASLHLYPSINTVYTNTTQNLTRTTAPNIGAPFDREFVLYGGMAVGKVDATLHTPLGAISGLVGLGFLPLWYETDIEGDSGLNYNPIVTAGFRYVIFTSQNVYIFASAESVTRATGDNLATAREVRLIDYQETSFGVGYFLPSLRRYF